MQRPTLNRLHQLLLITGALTFSWLAMQVVHEFGHIMHAWSSGGNVTAVVLHPLDISRTDVSPDPHPQFVAWGGPVWGSVIPLGIHAVTRWRRWPRAWLAAFFAGFCLIANGGYLLGGCLFPVGDAEVLLRAGAPRIALAAFGAGTLVSGLYLWNGLGRYFGLAREVAPIDKAAARVVAALAMILIGVELIFASR